MNYWKEKKMTPQEKTEWEREFLKSYELLEDVFLPLESHHGKLYPDDSNPTHRVLLKGQYQCNGIGVKGLAEELNDPSMITKFRLIEDRNSFYDKQKPSSVTAEVPFLDEEEIN